MILHRFITAVLSILLLPITGQAQDKAVDWSAINTIGLYSEGDPDLIKRNLWTGYTQDRAVQTLSYYPSALHSSAYRSVVRKILLAESKPLAETVDEPRLLVKRLESLLRFGLVEDAKALYDKVDDVAAKEHGLALIGLALLLKNGDLAPACLDIQAASANFRDMPAWRELDRYCHIRFGSPGKYGESDLAFKIYPAFKSMLAGSLDTLPVQSTPIETLVAFADKHISRSFYNDAARDIKSQSDLFIRLALDDQFKAFETHSCYVIEAANRGLIDRETLANTYKAVSFSDEDVSGKNKIVKMHPCNVPAFFYARFNALTDNADWKTELEIMLETTQDIPPTALTPLAPFMDRADYDESYAWKAALIRLAAGETIADSPLIYPLTLLQNANRIDRIKAKDWADAYKKSALSQNLVVDPALPVYYLRIFSGDFSKLEKKSDNFNYENFFSLTYVEKSLHSGIGKHDALSSAIDKDDVARLFMIALSQIGNISPNAISADDGATILSSLAKYKLEKEKHMFVIDALHR